jgi:hypothetical protein
VIELLPEKIRSKIVVAAGGCWRWTGAVTADGYAKLRWKGKITTAHRVVYELLVGPPPPQLHHRPTCPKDCSCPDHLTPMQTHAEHMAAHAELKTHCRHGHPYDDAYRRRDGRRYCRTCQNERTTARRKNRGK